MLSRFAWIKNTAFFAAALTLLAPASSVSSGDVLHAFVAGENLKLLALPKTADRPEMTLEVTCAQGKPTRLLFRQGPLRHVAFGTAANAATSSAHEGDTSWPILPVLPLDLAKELLAENSLCGVNSGQNRVAAPVIKAINLLDQYPLALR